MSFATPLVIAAGGAMGFGAKTYLARPPSAKKVDIFQLTPGVATALGFENVHDFSRSQLVTVYAKLVTSSQVGNGETAVDVADGEEQSLLKLRCSLKESEYDLDLLSIARAADARTMKSPFNLWNGTTVLSRTPAISNGMLVSAQLPYESGKISAEGTTIQLETAAQETDTISTVKVANLFVIPGSFDKEDHVILRDRIITKLTAI
jgi:hypothetical protein